MTNLIIKRGITVTLDGNALTGNTFPVKDYIKSYMGGKWNGAAKAWIVDVEKVNELIAKQAIRVDDEPITETKTTRHISELCPKCHTYCYGDCTA